MARRRINTEIILPRVSDQEKKDIPVWDAYIEKVILDGDIPRLIVDKIYRKINLLIMGCPQKFSGKLKGNIENILTDTEAGIYKKYGITYSKLRVKRENYDLVVTTNQDQPFDIWES